MLEILSTLPISVGVGAGSCAPAAVPPASPPPPHPPAAGRPQRAQPTCWQSCSSCAGPAAHTSAVAAAHPALLPGACATAPPGWGSAPRLGARPPAPSAPASAPAHGGSPGTRSGAAATHGPAHPAVRHRPRSQSAPVQSHNSSLRPSSLKKLIMCASNPHPSGGLPTTLLPQFRQLAS